MLEARRYRRAAEHLRGRLEAEDGRPLPLRAAAGVAARDRARRAPRRSTSPPGSARRSAACCATRRRSTSRHLGQVPRVSVAERLRILRSLLRAGARRSTRRSRGADRVTVCMTLFALLELYKQGEATWDQAEPFGEIVIARAPSSAAPAGAEARRERAGARRRGAAVPLARAGAARRSWPRLRGRRRGRRLRRWPSCARPSRRATRPRAQARSAGGWTLATDPDAEDAARRLLAKPRTPPLSPAQAETLVDRRLPAAGLAARDRAHPRRRVRLGDGDAARARADRGVRALAVRRGALPHDAAVPQALRPAVARRRCPTRPQWDPTPEEQGELRDRLLRAGDARAGVAARHRPTRPRAATSTTTSKSSPR